ncbi:MerR family transcriptional regulator [Nocardia nova]|uniref:MerR family transcriptional regulator n=1 Tax=Nocardia nova TaxID=37330 RepID=UPI0037A97470
MRSTPEGEDFGIGAVAHHFGLAEHVLRHWESTGLLNPARDPAGRRRYTAVDTQRIAMILRAKQAGLGLDSIRAMFNTTSADTRRDVLRHQHETLTATITAARSALAIVECALACEHDDFTQCPHFQAEVAEYLS